MRWSPNLEEVSFISNALTPTFAEYAQQEKYGLATFKAKHVQSVNSVIQRDTPLFIADARAELKLISYRRKVGFPTTDIGSRQWHGQQEDIVDFEIRNILRTAGLEREPSPYYRPNSKTTFKSAIQTDKFPVIGAKNLFLSTDHFKFTNPFFKSKERSESNKTSNGENNAGTSAGGCTAHCKLYAEPVIDVMRWSPKLDDEDVSFSYGLTPSFEHYEQEENYGLVTFNSEIVYKDVYEIESDTSSLKADARSSSGGRTAHSKSCAELTIDVTGKQYVTQAQLYALKRGQNRRTSLPHKNSLIRKNSAIGKEEKQKNL